MYLGIHIHICVQKLLIKDVINLKASKVELKRGFGGKKGKGEMI